MIDCNDVILKRYQRPVSGLLFTFQEGHDFGICLLLSRNKTGDECQVSERFPHFSFATTYSFMSLISSLKIKYQKYYTDIKIK